MGCPHTTFYRGKKVRVVLNDGESFVDKFVERLRNQIVFEKRKVMIEDVRSATVWRPIPERK